MASNAKLHAFRIGPHADLKLSILEFAKAKKIDAGGIVTCVGSLEQYHIRFANQNSGKKQKGFFEILSLTGTFSQTEGHFHIGVADGMGLVTGGHLLQDNLIYTTAEIIIAELQDVQFMRELDSTYGYQELVVREKK